MKLRISSIKIVQLTKLITPILLALTVLYYLFFYRLTTLIKLLSQPELKYIHHNSWSWLYIHPFYLPIDVLRIMLYYLYHHTNVIILILPSIIFSFISLICLILVLNFWHKRSITLLTIIMFATSSWFLHVSRIISNQTLYLAIIPILLLNYLMLKYKYRKYYIYYGLIISWSFLIFIPGIFPLVVATIIFSYNDLKKGWQYYQKLWQHFLYIFLILVSNLPLVYFLLKNHYYLSQWLRIDINNNIILVAKNILAVFLHIFINGPNDPTLWLGQLPITDIFSLGMIITGVYSYSRHIKSKRVKLLTILFFLSSLIIAFSGGISVLSLIIPLLYLVIADGLSYTLNYWFKIFPYNFYARYLGIFIIIIAVSLSTVYNLRSYFIAWPHNFKTIKTFNRKL